MRAVPRFSSERLTVIAWPDEVIDKMGHDPRGRYVETYWLGILGPSTTFLLRLMADELEANPHGFILDLNLAAKRIGLSYGGTHSPFNRAFGRLTQFELAQVRGPSLLAIRRVVPPLSRRHISRLPVPIQEQHAEWNARQLRRPKIQITQST